MIDALLPRLDAQRLELAVQIASVPEQIRGFGHVKLASIATARARWADLQQRFEQGPVVSVVSLSRLPRAG